MGLDGGTTMTRSDILRASSWRVANQDNTRSTRGGSISQSNTAYKEESVAKEDAAVMVYTTCALSDEPLQPPVVADYLGRLFNRSAVLEFLLAKKKDHFVDGAAGVHRLANTLRAAAGGSDHLESMKDVFAIKLENVEAAGGPSKSSQNETSKTAMEAPTSLVPYSCPITMLPCTRYLFSALPRCGHVLSNRALTNIKEQVCPLCSEPYSECIPIHPSKEQLEDLKARLADRSIAQRAAKRRKTKETKGAASLPLSNAPVSSVLLLEAPSDKSPVLLPEASSEIL